MARIRLKGDSIEISDPSCNCIYPHKPTLWQRLGRFRPDTLVYLNIRVPFLGITTSTMTYFFERREWTYILFNITLWRWNFTIRLGRKD